jgi:uncharacterized protein YggT (Ycf19 family)
MTSESTNQDSHQQTQNKRPSGLSAKQIGIRLLYTILFLVILVIVIAIIKVVVAFQYIYFFATRKSNEPVRRFSNKISTYAYRIFRYITLNENQRPFPFTDFPPELETPEEQISFD